MQGLTLHRLSVSGLNDGMERQGPSESVSWVFFSVQTTFRTEKPPPQDVEHYTNRCFKLISSTIWYEL